MFDRFFLSQDKILERDREINTLQFIEQCLHCVSMTFSASGIKYTFDNFNNRENFSRFLRKLGLKFYDSAGDIEQPVVSIDLLFGASTSKNILSTETVKLWQSLLHDYVAKKKPLNLNPIKNFTIIDQIRILLLAPHNLLALAAQIPNPSYLLSFTSSFHKSVLSHALVKLHKEQTALDYAAIHQESKSFTHLVDSVVPKCIDNALHLSKAPNAIYHAAQYQSTEALQNLVARTQYKPSLDCHDNSDLSLLESLLFRHSHSLALLWWNKQYKMPAWIQDDLGLQPLRNQPLETIQTSKNHTISLEQANIIDIIWKEGFASCIDCQNAYAYARKTRHQTLLTTLETLLRLKKVYTGMPFAQEKYVAYLEDKRPERFHEAVKKFATEDIANLIESLPPSILENDILMLDEKRQTGFKVAARYLDEKPFALLCNAISTVSINKLRSAMIATDDSGENAFHNIATYQSADNFILCLDLGCTNNNILHEIDAPDEALLIQNVQNATPMHLAAYHQEGKSISALIKCITDSTLKKALYSTDANGNTFLHLIIARQTHAIAKELISHISISPSHNTRTALYAACNRPNQSNQYPLDLALKYQSPEFVFDLLTILISEGIYIYKAIVSACLKNPYSRRNLVYSLLREENRVITGMLSICAENEFRDYFIQCYLEAHHNGMALTHLATSLYETLTRTLSQVNLSSYAQLMISDVNKPFSVMPPATTAYSSKRTPLDPDDEASFLPTLWREGLQSIQDYRFLQKIQLSRPKLRSTLERLMYSNCLFTGSYQDLQPESISDIGLPYINSMFNSTLLQYIDPAEWPTFLQRLNRQVREEQKPAAKRITHQYRHLENDIIPYVNEEDKEEMEKYPIRYARTIYLANGLNTNLMQNEEKAPPRVGLCYHRFDSKTVAFFTRQIDTQQQKWLGTEKQVASYKRSIASFQQLSDVDMIFFQQKNPYQVNLTLAHVSPEGAFAICIVDNTLDSRLYAQTMEADFSATFHRHLPIICFNYFYRSLRIYLPEEQAADRLEKEKGIKLNPFLEQESRARLLALREDLQSYKSWIAKGLFSSQRQENTPKPVADIVTRITETEKSPLPFWEKTAKAINKQLKALGGNGNENEKFLETKRVQYFK